MKIKAVFLQFLIVVFFQQIIVCQETQRSSEITVKHKKDFEHLGINFSEISKLKIYLHKDTFRDEEIFTLDIGLLTSKTFYYYPKFGDTVNIIIKNAKGKRVNIESLFSFDRFMKFEKYKNHIIRYPRRFIVGCEGKALKKFKKDFLVVDEDNTSDESDIVEYMFNRNMFWGIPDRCINIKKSQDVEIYAELSNSLVVLDKKNPI